MLKIKQHIALFLLLIVVSFSLNLHGLSHVLDNDFADDKHCEICILHHQHHENSVSIFPLIDYFENITITDDTNFKVDFNAYQVVYENLYFEGQYYNKPPPEYIY